MNTYRNVKTGAEVVTNNIIVADDWEEVKASQSNKKASKKKAVHDGQLSNDRRDDSHVETDD